MEMKKRSRVILELGITDEIALISQIMKNSDIKKVDFIESDVLKIEYNNGSDWILTVNEIEDVQKKKFIKFE